MQANIKLFFLLLFVIFVSNKLMAAIQDLDINKPIYKPFIERYVLDELKLLRQDQQRLREDVTNKMTADKLDVTDRSIILATDTINNVFYTIATASSILLLFGWKSLKDIKGEIKSTIESRVTKLTAAYEARVNDLEKNAKVRSQQILDTQEQVSKTEVIHSLWLKSGIEENPKEKIKIYNEILQISPDDIGALTYKADILLDLNEPRWALSLCNEAIKIDNNYALSYWQRAGANIQLEMYDDAIKDIKMAVNISPTLKDDLEKEVIFNKIRKNPEFKKLLV